MQEHNINKIHAWVRDQKALNRWSYEDLADITNMSISGIRKALQLNTLDINRLMLIVDHYQLRDEFGAFFAQKGNNNANNSLSYQQQLDKIPVAEIMIYLSKYRKEKFEPDPLYQALKQLIEAEYEKTTFQEKYEDLLSKLSAGN